MLNDAGIIGSRFPRPVHRGGSRGFDRTLYCCSFKLILSLNIKYCMIMCAIVSETFIQACFECWNITILLASGGPHILDCLLVKLKPPFKISVYGPVSSHLCNILSGILSSVISNSFKNTFSERRSDQVK